MNALDWLQESYIRRQVSQSWTSGLRSKKDIRAVIWRLQILVLSHIRRAVARQRREADGRGLLHVLMATTPHILSTISPKLAESVFDSAGLDLVDQSAILVSDLKDWVSSGEPLDSWASPSRGLQLGPVFESFSVDPETVVDTARKTLSCLTAIDQEKA